MEEVAAKIVSIFALGAQAPRTLIALNVSQMPVSTQELARVTTATTVIMEHALSAIICVTDALPVEPRIAKLAFQMCSKWMALQLPVYRVVGLGTTPITGSVMVKFVSFRMRLTLSQLYWQREHELWGMCCKHLQSVINQYLCKQLWLSCWCILH